MSHDDLPDPSEILTARVIDDEREILAMIQRACAPYRPKPPDPALAGARTQIAYRLIRAAAKIQGWAEDDQALIEAIDDQWDVAPSGPRAIPMRSEHALELEVTLPDDPDEAFDALPELSPVPEEDLPRALLRMPLLPHALPEPHVERWTRVMVALSTKVRFDQEPVQALKEILGTQVGGVRAAWPTRDEIIAFEESLIETTTASLVESTRKGTRKLLTELGFSTRECKTFETIAMIRAKDLTNIDIQEKKALMEMKLEDLVDRARNMPGEIRSELMGLKTLSIIQGLAKADIENDDEIFARVVSKVAKVRDTTAVVTPGGPRKALGP